MDGVFFAALCTVVGALAFDIWGFIQAKKACHETPDLESFDWAICATTVLPGLALAITTGLAIDYVMPHDLTAIVVSAWTLATSGFGIAAGQGKLGVNSFFRTKK